MLIHTHTRFIQKMSTLLLVVVASILFVLPVQAQAPSASLSLSPSNGTHEYTDSFTVDVRVNTGGEAVNGIEARLSYNDSLLDFVSIDASSSAFSIEASSSGGGGLVTIERANITAVTNSNALVARVRFKAASTAGNATVSFLGTSKVVRASDSSDILGSTSGGTYTIEAPPDSGGGSSGGGSSGGGSSGGGSSNNSGGSSSSGGSNSNNDSSSQNNSNNNQNNNSNANDSEMNNGTDAEQSEAEAAMEEEEPEEDSGIAFYNGTTASLLLGVFTGLAMSFVGFYIFRRLPSQVKSNIRDVGSSVGIAKGAHAPGARIEPGKDPSEVRKNDSKTLTQIEKEANAKKDN